MSNVTFLWIFSRGIELGFVLLCLLPLRMLLRRKTPHFFSFILWSVLPANIIYDLVLRGCSHFTNSVYIHKTPGISLDENIVNGMKWCWICGMVLVILWLVFSYIRFLRKLTGSIRLKKGVYLTDGIKVPFTLGLLCPKIYLPVSLKEEYYEYVVLHEKVHIARKDIWMKYLAVVFLGLFWFQPLLWIGFRLFMEDMEEACDEGVIRMRDSEFREEYAKALVDISSQPERVRGAAIGYGNGAIKSRVLNIANYRQLRLRGRLLTVGVCILFVIVSVMISCNVPKVVQRHAKVQATEVRIWQTGMGITIGK